MKTITLKNPITNGKATIETIDVREPSAGDLRGVKLYDVFQGDTAAYIDMLPRITTPSLTKAQVAMLSLPDLLQIMETVGEWLTGNEETAATD